MGSRRFAFLVGLLGIPGLDLLALDDLTTAAGGNPSRGETGVPTLYRPIRMLVILTLLSAVPAPGRAQEEPDSLFQNQPAIPEVALEEVALQWLDLLREEAFDSAAAQVAPAARRQLGGDQLAEMWMGLLGRFGELGEMKPLKKMRRGSFVIVAVLGSFERSDRTLQVSFDAQRRVAGFVVVAARR